MGFLAPFIPLIAAGVGTAGTLVASHNSNSTMQNIANQQQSLAQQQLAITKPAYDQSFNFYSGLANGGPQMQSVLTPSINAINSQYGQQYQNILNDAYGRGGGLSAALAGLNSSKGYALSNLYGQAQQAGAAGLAQLAGNTAGNAAGVLASAQQGAIQNQTMQNQAYNNIGSIFTRLLSSPGLFAGGVPSAPNKGNLPASYYPAQPGTAGFQMPNVSGMQNPWAGMGSPTDIPAYTGTFESLNG